MMLFVRRVPLWKRIARLAIATGIATGVAFGAELLRKKLGIGTTTVRVARNARGTRMRVSLRTTKRGRRGARRTTITTARS